MTAETGKREKIIPRCDECICYIETDNDPIRELGSKKKGECHLNPPQVVAVVTQMGPGVGSGFPKVSCDWWCMRFHPRKAAVMDDKPATSGAPN